MAYQPNSRPNQDYRSTFTPQAKDPNAMDIDRLTIEERNEYIHKGKCFRCGKTGHISRDHITDPSLNTGKGNSPSQTSKLTTPYKAIMPAKPRNAKEAVRNIKAMMADFEGEDLTKVKIAFLESINEETPSTSKIEEADEDEDFQEED